MHLDFKEIPAGNKEGASQGDFEHFAREFLQLLGYIIVGHPGPGVDGGQDLIVEKAFQRDVGHLRLRYLVSCKHYAHSGHAVGVRDEVNIFERMHRHACNGFIGFYSTKATKGLYDQLEGGPKPIEFQIFDATTIEKHLTNSSPVEVKSLLSMFLPASGTKFIEQHFVASINSSDGGVLGSSTFETLVAANMTAMILLEIDRIEHDYISIEWDKTEEGLGMLARFERRNNPMIAKRMFDLLNNVAVLTRGKMPNNVAQSVFWLVCGFFPMDDDLDTLAHRNEMGVIGNEIAFGLVYDATIYLNDLAVAKWGLLIFKYFYMKRNRQSTLEIRKDVLKRYKELKDTLKREDWSDLSKAQRLVQLFKQDLEVNQLGWPPLPPDLAD